MNPRFVLAARIAYWLAWLATLLYILLPAPAHAVCSATDNYSNTICQLSANLVGYWRMQEASGNLADASGNGRTLTATGSASYSQTGPFGTETGILSNSSGVHFDRADEVAFDFGTGAFSAECWIKQGSGTSFGAYFQQVGSGGSGGWSLGSDGSGNFPKIWFNSSSPSLSCSDSDCTPTGNGVWAHISFVRTAASGANTLRVYDRCVNPANNCYIFRGGDFTGADASNANVNNTQNLSTHFSTVFGGGAPVNLVLSECALYNAALSTADNDNHFLCGFDGSGCTNLPSAVPARRIFQSSLDPRQAPLRRAVAQQVALLPRGLPALLVPEPYFRLERLWHLAAVVPGQYEAP